MNDLEHWLGYLDQIPYGRRIAALVGLVVIATIAYVIAKRIVLRIVQAIIKRTKWEWDDVIEERGVFNALAWIAPALIAYYAAYTFGEEAEGIVQRLLLAYILAVLILVFGRMLDAGNLIYNRTDRARELPIKGYIQVIKLIAVLIGVIVIFATLLNQSPWGLLSGLGAMTAILLLVFRDTILSFVASIQIATNDMIRIGDWVSMPQFGTDGDVVDIALHVVKIQNWDKTITSVPTKAFIESSFKNWRGMTESGGRRIKRAIALDASSIRFLTDEELSKLSKIEVLQPYLEEKKTALAEANAGKKLEDSPVNGRRLTNVGTFRAYVSAYLKTNPKLHADMTFLVRQLEPGPKGVPIELYVFSNDIAWANYEAIQADIFDHLMAAVPEFGLRVFQEPTGYDFGRLGAQ
ncbi:MAG: mechanosensitive ion channel [Deltaproteobacteria bacterium]